VEELLQASWAEVALQKRIYLQEHAVATPPAVQRELDTVLPTAERGGPKARWLRLSLAAAVSGSQGGLVLLGPDLMFGAAPASWLEISLRAGYRASLTVAAQHGEIRADALLGGLFLEPRWQANAVVSLCFPQGMDVAQVRFSGLANDSGRGRGGNRVALVVSHAAGLRIAFNTRVSITLLGRFMWTLLPAEAADELRTVTGVAGVGGEGALSVDTHF
jgi:hypothetical protein